MSPLKLLAQDKIGDVLNLLPISRENLRKTDPCLWSFASQIDPSVRHICTMVDIGSAATQPGTNLLTHTQPGTPMTRTQRGVNL